MQQQRIRLYADLHSCMQVSQQPTYDVCLFVYCMQATLAEEPSALVLCICSMHIHLAPQKYSHNSILQHSWTAGLQPNASLLRSSDSVVHSAFTHNQGWQAVRLMSTHSLRTAQQAQTMLLRTTASEGLDHKQGAVPVCCSVCVYLV